MTRTPILVALGMLLAAAALLVAVLTGSSGIGWPETDTAWRIALELRLPRAIAALVTGGLLALAGVLMQVLLRNPLADPYILGLSGGAAAFVLGGMSLGLVLLPTELLAFAGALFSMLIVFVLGRGEGPWSTTRLLLTGVVVAAGWGAVISLLLALGDDASLKGMLYWLMGDLGYSTLSPWWLLVLAGLTAALMLRARSLNVLAAGETQAALLGESPKRRHAEIYVAASLLTALAVAIAGTVGFVGLIVPHLVRLTVGADHRRLLPISALAGGVFLLLADTLARTVIAPRQLPVGVLTALLGVPLFLLLLRRAGGVR
ncbi:iron ABC transporter permease [Wenzhouxiangella sp. XN79A]|uniref:FecCD family ABC transporter permease n=1 Tax=Wenzhouxiangella sp. XN79A TaxID=2724193 RepID=UPI00144ABAD3|nr:iron ABC transporter permease [Wenzhouxiangella sp. XN79A]NKI33640.1 iron ABC transporter permease [Wenzhouxiangella sp. XN79A]